MEENEKTPVELDLPAKPKRRSRGKKKTLADKIAENRKQKMRKYEVLGQLKDGKLTDKAGNLIDNARIQKYEAMCHHRIHHSLPAGALHEASMDYEDLMNAARFEVFKCLLNGVDPEKAMGSTIEDPVLRQKQINWKEKNPGEALRLNEQSMVFGRLRGFFRREQYNHHPDQKGGRTVTMSGSSFAQAREVTLAAAGGSDDEMIALVEPAEAFGDAEIESLLVSLDGKGADAARRAFKALPQDRQEQVKEILFRRTSRGDEALVFWDEKETDESD